MNINTSLLKFKKIHKKNKNQIIFHKTKCSNNKVVENIINKFLIKKKDPLVLPPDYENLPNPEEGAIASEEEFSIFQKTLDSSVDQSSSQSGSVEESILKKIQRK